MTFTLVAPTSGRFGPGCFATFTDDLIGPYAPSAVGYFAIEETATGRILIATQQFMAHTMFFTPGVHGPPAFGISRSNQGTADGTAIQIHAYQTVSGGSPFADLVVTGFEWDAVSNLWEANYLNSSFVVSGLAGAPTTLASILAAVKQTYTTP